MEPNPYESPKEAGLHIRVNDTASGCRPVHSRLVLGTAGLVAAVGAWIWHDVSRLPVPSLFNETVIAVGLLSLVTFACAIWQLTGEQQAEELLGSRD